MHMKLQAFEYIYASLVMHHVQWRDEGQIFWTALHASH